MQEKHHDAKPIAGDYQLNALTKGHPLQRAWHHGRISHLMENLHFNKTDVVADIGCGSGINLAKIALKIQSGIGIDSNQEALKFCQDYFKTSPHITFKYAQIDQTGITSESLNKIICMEVIEHVYEQQVENALIHWKTLLKSGGEIYITTPNYQSFWPILEWCLDRTSMIHQLAEEQHVSKWSAKKLYLALSKAGFKDIEVGSFNFLQPFKFFTHNDTASNLITSAEKKFPDFIGPLLYAKAKK
jgi:2-polyprenyl-3-methyl-5-hydroxy-6-metoxy-1,4-benzoquinol methylase